ncbi:serine/threonine dehydratase [Virgisporangium aliadipatigenens]|uniref:threonine ammonia-lyase n=1 Tax=Virgisporangium aliadipatigenens TaxID=741659 RepID=A0A8J3YU86_9ACTN|nr:pyridoxal-phosphate dependent enzyme [Virgisporangium aliadipatigenens]GIJ52009.1 serine/threonine dehydratase [Virgisporangium aliadipatigenens]
MELVTLADIRTAADHIAGVAVRTPLLPAWWAGTDLWLKPEGLQPIGSFKLRGAYNTVASLPEEKRRAGIIAHSSGNHAQAAAYSARAFGVPCVVVMPNVAVPMKVEATRALGAEVILVPPPERDDVMAKIAQERGLNRVPPFDHPDVIAGQGTIGLEIVADLPDVDVVLVPVGGGGLASGVASAIKALRPAAAVIGVEPALAADAADSLSSGELRKWPTEQTYRTIADGLRTNLSELTFAHLSERLDGMVTVSEDEILDAMTRMVRGSRVLVEPSGAVATAAYLHHRAELPQGRTAAVVSGGNADPKLLADVFV